MQETPGITAELEKVRDYLAEEGYRPSVKKEDILLDYRGWRVIVGNDQDDTDYFYVLIPYFWEIESDSERAMALEAASEVTGRFKVSKVWLTSDRTNVSAMTGAFSKTPEAFCEVVGRHISIATASVEAFRSRMIEMRSATPPPAEAGP